MVTPSYFFEKGDRALKLLVKKPSWPELLNNLGVTGYKARSSGRVYLKCFFHEEKTSSLVLYQDRDPWHYHCYGCQAHGGIIRFIAMVVFHHCLPEDPRDENYKDKAIIAEVVRLWEAFPAALPAPTFFGQPWSNVLDLNPVPY